MNNEELAVLAKNGDNKAFEELIKCNDALFHHFTKKYCHSKQREYEDILSIVKLGFVKAVQSFDIDKGYKLTTYAGRLITNEVVMYLRNMESRIWSREDCVLDSPISEEDSMVDTFQDKYDIEDDVVKRTIYEALEDSINTLNPREQKMLKMYYYDDLPYKDIAPLFNVGDRRVGHIIRDSLKKLKDMMMERGYESYEY